MGKTTIEWTDRSVNPIRARWWASTGHYCVKVSPGCKNCYSSRMQPRFGLPQFQEQRRDDATQPFLDATKLQEVIRRRAPTKWFWCDMTDMFGEWVPDEWIAACFGVMAATPQHTHQVLTKRPERMRAWFRWLDDEGRLDSNGDPARWYPFGVECAKYGIGVNEPMRQAIASHPRRSDVRDRRWPLPNVWLGVSVEDQRRADERIPILLETPAAVRFISAEPLLGPVDLGNVHGPFGYFDAFHIRSEVQGRLDWVIAGAESGRGARPMDIDWARSLRDQCAAAGVPFFYKQDIYEGRKRGLPWLDGRQHVEWPDTRTPQRGGGEGA